ncbi:MAG: hypothetical protein JWO38_2853 [Gemmataceae bacterium]|nr:hypothetical protein [Gemmataceae bacterium]
MPKADIAIITVIAEEYTAVTTRLERQGCRLRHDPGSQRQPNQYGWVTGELSDAWGQAFQLVVAATILPGHTRMANAVSTTVSRFKPRYVLLVGIAGGFPLDGLTRGDVAISSVIYDYEYGKIAGEFQPRHDFTYQVDEGLLRSSVTLHARDQTWTTVDCQLRPSGFDGVPKLITGPIASGNKVVDNADNAFFAQVRAGWPRLLAVEMEGAGAASAIESARAGGQRVGFLMVRGISDMPRVGAETGLESVPLEGNKEERDTWKRYAAAVAASFTVQWITRAWPVPARRPPRASTTLPQGGAGPPPPGAGGGAEGGAKAVIVESLTDAPETSIWLGYSPPPLLPLLTPAVGSERRGRLKIPATVAPGELKSPFARASTDLLRWPTTVSGGRWLDRPELRVLAGRITSERDSVSVVLGPPGSGKSAFLARLGQQLVAGGFSVLAIKADQLWRSIDSPAKLAERLTLPAPTDQAVLAVADVEPVVVLLDQLDALADLADLKSDRLHVLLNLIHGLAGQPGVHVVCSCREFEYQHDGRLNRLGANEIRLQPPTWEQVSEVLAERDIDGTGWPDDAKTLLRVPYHLSLFLNRLLGSGEQPVFTTYQQLFNDLWQERVVSPGGGRAELLQDLTGQLAEQEELWTDRGRFDDRWATVEGLIAADVLCLTEDGFRVGFRHQSLFEFVRAKTFSRDNASLASYVLVRQDGLFVRPTLWMTLNYLRRANPAVYAREFNILWNRPTLRRHVRHLLIDFLSQLEQPLPTDWEQARLVAALHDGSWRRKVLTAISGKKVWFDLFAGTQLSAEMRKPFLEAGDVVWVLVAAFGFDRGRCLRLMQEHWLPDESKLLLAWRTLTYLNEWNESAVGLAVAIAERTAIEQGGMWQLAQTVATSEPTLAVRLVAAWLDAACRRAVMSASDGGDDHAGRLRMLLDSHGQWHDVGKLAERVPVEFARRLWPALRELAIHLGNTPSDYVVRYADDHLRFARLDRREYVALDSPDQFFLAIDAAIRELARTQPEEFCALLREADNPDSNLLQRLLCRGVREIAPSHPTFALEYLTADPRRFWLGGLNDDQGDSVELVAALAPHLTEDQMGRLTAAIRGWELYREGGGEERGPDDVYTRGRRFRLLTALPVERLPDEVRREIEAERSSLPAYVQTARSHTWTGMQLIGSPVSHTEMDGLADAEIIALFDELPDSTEGHHPNDWMVGGSVQLSREFEEFAKGHPDRAVAVLERLRPGAQERPAAHGIRGLVAAKRPVSEVIALVRQLDARGFTGQEFRETVAFSLDDLGRADGLPDAACELLHRWRLAAWPDNDRDEDERGERDDSRRPASILWQYGGTVTLPHGRFPVLSALTRGYLCRRPHAADLWLGMLRDHVEREEGLTNWRAMCLYLGDVCCCSDRDQARAFLDRLFERFPDVTRCQLGVRLLARVSQLLSEDGRQRAYGMVREWGADRGSQAFGELVCLRHLQQSEDLWASQQVEAALAESTNPGHEWVSVGVAFAAAHLWEEPACRARAAEVLCRLIPRSAERIAYAAMTVYRTRDELPLDEPMLRLLRQVEAHPDVLVRSGVDEAFFDHLLDAFVVDVELVCRIGEEAVRRLGAELQSVQHRLYMASPALIDISLRLQRSGGDYRRRGMELFETLLDLGVTEAVNITRCNDLRLAAGGIPVRLPRRKRSPG